MTQETEQEEPRSLDIIFAEVKDRLKAQSDQIKALDQKAGLVVSSSSLIITIGAGLRTALEKSGPAEVTLPSVCSFALFVLAGVLYLLTMIFAFRAYSLLRYRRDPEPRPLREHYMFENPTSTKRKILANMIQCFEENQKIIHHNKVRNLRIALSLLIAETMALVAAFLLPSLLAVLTPSFTWFIMFALRCLIAIFKKG